MKIRKRASGKKPFDDKNKSLNVRLLSWKKVTLDFHSYTPSLITFPSFHRILIIQNI